MKTYLDCYPCFLRQALEASRMAGLDETRQYRVLKNVMNELHRFEPGSTPPKMAYSIHQLVRREMNGQDPYRSAKEESTRQALALYPRLQTLVAEADDPLEMAVRLSIAGNIIDLGMAREYDLEGTIERVLVQPFAINALEKLRKALAQADQVLYLADNAGETVFDRLLIEILDKPVTYVVKGGPILNDATRQDALDAGLDLVATIVDNGSQAPGTLIELCSEAFRNRFVSSGLIIAKGQANYESLSETTAPVFFLLQAKCAIIAQDLRVRSRSIICGYGLNKANHANRYNPG